MLEQIKLEKQKLIKDGKLKKSALTDSVIFKGDDNKYFEKVGKTEQDITDEIPFEIPDDWKWCRIGSVLNIWSARRVHGDDNKYFEKVGKTEQDITDEIPFEIPDDWKWCRIGSVLNIWSARRVHERDWRSSGIPFYRAREIGKMADWGHVDNDLFIEQSLYDEFSKSGVPQIGDLMMTAVGTLGKTYVVETNNPFYYKDGSVLCIGNPFRLNPYYLKLFFESSAFANQYLSESDGTTVATLTMVRLNRYLIPVPPLKEQTRIVEKIKTVTSIMSNKYYEQVGNENIDITEEIPFDLPENWTWVRFGQYVRMSIGKTPPRGETKYWANGKYPWVSISDMSDYGLVTTTKESVSEYAKSLFGEISPVGTLIMSFKLTVGRTSLLNTSAYHNEAIISIYPFVDKNYQARNFLFHILPIISNLGDTKDAIKGKTLNSKSLNNLLLPLPPLNEQGRIVAMIELLFDKLK